MEQQLTIEKSIDDKIDQLELLMSKCPIIECPLKHSFTPGIYIREIFMPAGTLITSMIHKTRHPFFILYGKVLVFSENDGEQLLQGPHRGITEPGTRRVLYVIKNCVWITMHGCSDGETVDQIEERIIEKHDNPLLDEYQKKIFYQLHRHGLGETLKLS